MACDIIFCGTLRTPGLRIWSPKNCSPKEKKSFKLKIRENSDYRRDEKFSSSY